VRPGCVLLCAFVAIEARVARPMLPLRFFRNPSFTASWWLFLPGLLVAMVGTGLFNPTISQVALSSAPAEQSGLAAGVNDMFRQAGIAVGVAALGALVPAGAALGEGSAQSYVDGLHDALWVGAVVALAAATATALLIRGRRRDEEDVVGDVAFQAV
jgi:hypothetical protein